MAPGDAAVGGRRPEVPSVHGSRGGLVPVHLIGPERTPWQGRSGRAIMARKLIAPFRPSRREVFMGTSEDRPEIHLSEIPRGRCPRTSTRNRFPVGLGILILGGTVAAAADLSEAEKLFRTGQYDQCAALAGAEIGKDADDQRWCLLKIQAEFTRGKYGEAMASLEDGLRRFPASLSLLLLGRDVYRANGRLGDALAMTKIFEQLVTEDPRLYNSPEGRIVLGRYLLLRGADSRKVLDQLYDVALKERPDLIEAYYATAELALQKEDYALAAETLQKTPKEAALDPRHHYLLARAFENDDRARSAKELAEALKINPRHLDSLLLRVDERIDSEAYAEARKELQQISELNPAEPRAWAYRAVLAHLDGKPDEEAAARKSALSGWAENPEVDHLIGRKLAQKYRFAEGAAAQKRALAMDADYLPAKVQLCQDLLRLGDEEEGWKLADEVFARDGYNVVAYNLVTLHGRLSGFRTLRQDGLLVRMEPREADLYGARVLDLARPRPQGPVREVRRRAHGTRDRRDLPPQERVRRADVRPAGSRWAPGGMLRAGDHGEQPGVAGREPLELGGRPLARVLPRGHPDQDAEQDAAVVERGDLGLRGGAEGPVMGADGDSAIPRDAPGTGVHPAVQAELGFPGGQVSRPPPVRLSRVGHGGRFPGRQVRPAGPQGTAGGPRHGNLDRPGAAGPDPDDA